MSTDLDHMHDAIAAGASVRQMTSPNPWVGAVVVAANGSVVGTGATNLPGGPHAEVEALISAGDASYLSTLYVTLEPCDHSGRTGPCTQAIIEAGVRRVVVGLEDPDRQVRGRGIERLLDAGLTVDLGVASEEITEDLKPYLHHRKTGRPYVVLKLATTLDGRIAAPDGTSAWITGSAARSDVHQLRAYSDAICVGANTVRMDDPALTVREWMPVNGGSIREPRRIVLGELSEDSRVWPAETYVGSLENLIQELGNQGVLQLLIEGGADVAGRFHRSGLVDRYVIYIAPALLGGDDGRPILAGPGVATMSELRRGRFVSMRRLGDDIRLDLVFDQL